jgi:hypothetical protein
MPSGYDNCTERSVQPSLALSVIASSAVAQLGASQASSSPDPSLPPLPAIESNITNEPSPLTLPSSSAPSTQNEVRISARRVEYDTTSNGVLLSVPVTSDLPQANRANCSQYQEGYDSDGEIGPFFDAIENQRYDNDEIFNEEEPERAEENIVNEESEMQQADEPMANLPNYHTMTVAQLKDELRKRNLSVNGRKEVLIQRLLTPQPSNMAGQRANTTREQRNPQALPGFSPHAAWVSLTCSNERVQEPNQHHPHLVGPTVPTGQQEAPKFNFAETFDRPPFTAMTSSVKVNAHGKPLHGRNGQPIYQDEIRDEGRANIEWLKSKKLTSDSTPAQWIDALLPLKKRQGDSTGIVTVEEWATYTNLKAILLNAGSTIYQGTFVPFTPQEIRRFVALYILQGLSPSPQIKMKFLSQSMDPINGSDLCYRVFGLNASKRHKEFKAFFTIQDPRKIVPSKKTHPNFKVDPFLRSIQAESMQAFDLGKYISIDEQTIGFKGNHADKLRISYKKEGDGFQCDAICCDGFTYSFFMRNMPAPKSYLDKGLSPLHARCLFLLDQVKDQYHVCGVDNLYTSARFFREAYIGKNKVLCHGVARKSGRGIPKSVIQEEMKKKTDQDRMRGTTKAAVLTNDPDIPDLVAFSVYDTKPVHFLSMACTGLKWIEKKKKVFDSHAQRSINMSFLRPEVTDMYNNDMNNVDIADQLRGTYRLDRWMRKRKWWWSIWMWGVQVLLVNAYVLYRSAHLLIWKTEKKKILSHYDFREQIVKAWLEGDSGNESQRKRKQVSTSSSEGDEVGRGRTRSSTISIQTSASLTRRSCKVTDSTLDPTSGELKVRLDNDFHYPTPPPGNKYPPCSLCRWALSDGTSRDTRVRGASISTCDRCNVSLCLSCFKPFHTITDVAKLKSEVRKRHESKNNGNT